MTAPLLLPLLLVVAQPAPAPLPVGDARVVVEVGGHAIDCYTYRPKGYKNGPLVLVFHGMLRNADTYRDNARGIGDRCGALVVAPHFDAERFPNVAYQQGGLFREKKLQPRDRWTWSLVPELADVVRRREGRPELPYYLIGHSAGGQFLSRLSGFVATDAVRTVAANPGTHLFPAREMTFPYGFGTLPADLSGDADLKRYLGRRLTVYLGTEDTKSEDLDTSAPANRQGLTRYERGRNCFRQAQELAGAKGWPFRWTLVEAPGVGHDARAMFNHPNCAEALFGKRAARAVGGADE